MEINDATKAELLSMADDLRALAQRMDTLYKHADREIVQISNKAHSHAWCALSDVLAVLTDGKADNHLLDDVMLDCPDESTEKCIEIWKEHYKTD